MNIQPLQYEDRPSLIDLQPEGWPSILPHFDFYLNSAFCFPIKVIIDDKIAGIGTAVVHHDIAWLAHIIVHPNFRNRGLGRLITQKLVDDLEAKKHRTIYLIATDLGAPVYEKVGFITETEYIFFKDLEFDPNSTASKYITSFKEDYKEQLIHIDKEVTGESRLIQNERHLASAHIYVINDKVEGYYLPTWGEGLIIAHNPSAGIELMKIRLKESKNAAFPIDNLAAADFLHHHNFKEFKTAKRMRLGTKRTWQPSKIYNRIGGTIG